MPDRPHGSQFVTRDGVELMIMQALDPIKRQLNSMQAHGESLYGNGSGKPGKIEEIESKQDDRWGKQEDWKKTVDSSLRHVTNILSTKTAVAKDRRWIVAQVLTLALILADIWARAHGK